jgi:hypothetical protein
MKNTVLRLITVFGIALLLSSCSTTKQLVVDPNNPAGQNAEITFVNKGGSFYLQEWNGVDINERLYPKDKFSPTDKSVLTVPAGDNSFVFNVSYEYGGLRYTIRVNYDNIELRYNLEAGKKYEVKGRSQFVSLLRHPDFFVGIYDVTTTRTLLKEWKMEE